MSERLLRLACTATVTTWALLATAPAVAVPDPVPGSTAQPDPTPGATTAPEPVPTFTAQPAPVPSATTEPGPAPTSAAQPGLAPSPTAPPAQAAVPPVQPTTPPVQPANPPISQLLTDLQQLYRAAEQATEAYNATTEKLKQRRADVDRLDGQLARTRLDLQSSRVEAGRLARQQYQSSTSLSPYVRLLFARDPQHALDEGHLIAQLTRERAATVNQLTGAERSADALARAARKALDDQLSLSDRRKKARDDVEQRLKDIERLLAALTPEQLAALARYEQDTAAAAQQAFLASGALGAERTPTAAGARALRYATEQIGKPYAWGAEGPTAYDCSGLTSRAWQHAGRAIPRTSQEQWARLPHVSLRDLRPGDLVVYYPEATHVALYLGEGKVIEAPRPGARIKVSPIAAYPVRGAVRPGAWGQEPATDAR